MSAHSILRRGMDAAHAAVTASEDGHHHQKIVVRISTGAALAFLLTIAAFFVLLFAITYTYGHLIPALCMIESPETNAYVPVETISSSEEPPAYGEDEDGLPKTNEPEVLLIRNKPFTASLRETVQHLRARAGFWSRFRGLGLFVIWGFLRNILIVILSLRSRNPFIVSVTAIVAEVLLAHIHMTWIHIVISEPSEKRWYQRIPSLRGNWVKIAPAVLLWSFVTQLVHVLPMLMFGTWGALRHMNDPTFEPSRKHIYISATQLFMVMIFTLIMFVGLEIPATVTMTRVAASMLPEEDETIVPFDRSFGGRTTPTIIGGQGKIGIVEAWKTFPWQSRVRLLKLCAKVAAMIVALWIGFTFVIAAELHMMFSEEDLKKLLGALHRIKRT